MVDTANRVFLSHRGADKAMVRAFARVLADLGFHPWLDEDAMAAGEQLDRGLLRGIDESCAAVFFVTPSFEDAGYLSTEIEHALAAAQSRPEFRIISLALPVDGKRGTVPAPLRGYAWKEPSSELEALREILRAIPLEVGPVHRKGEGPIDADTNALLERYLEDSRSAEYTMAKEQLARWAGGYPGVFQPRHILGAEDFAEPILRAFTDYRAGAPTSAIYQSRQSFNKFWDRLYAHLGPSTPAMHRIFDTIGDNLRFLAITHPFEILEAKQVSRGKPTLVRLRKDFVAWVKLEPQRKETFLKLGLLPDAESDVWTCTWPWRV